MARSAYEALSALEKLVPSMKRRLGQPLCPMRIRGCQTLEQLRGPVEGDEIHLFPDFITHKNFAFMQIVIGIALIAVSFIPGIGPVTANIILGMGISMTIGGVIALLSPSPSLDNSTSVASSKYLSSSGNTVAYGTRIPIILGRTRAAGHYVSFNVDAKIVST